MGKGVTSFIAERTKETIDPKILARWTSKNQDERTVYVFGGLSFFFTLLGLLLVFFGTSTNHYSVKYTDQDGCGSGLTCTVSLYLEKELKAPVYFYLSVENLYQNNRIYSESRNTDQLKGQDIPVGGLSSCSPMITNKDAEITKDDPPTTVLAADGSTPLQAQSPMIPCGFAAYTFPTETFTLKDKDGNTISISTDEIAWPIDRKTYKNVDLSRQWLNMEDERFMNWMKIAGIDSFKKLWGIIRSDLPAGVYTVEIAHTKRTSFLYESFNLQKSVLLSTLNRLGGQNLLIAICYLVAAAISWSIFAIFMCRKIRNQRVKTR